MTLHHIFRSILVLSLVLVAAFATQPSHAATQTLSRYHNDALGSPIAATGPTGNLLWRESYRPYGERLDNQAAGATNPIWYTGKRQDPETGLVYMGARYYNPALGRFLSMDPVGPDENNLHSLNRYAYANNNPYKFTDPDGQVPVLVPFVLAWMGGGAAVTGGVNASIQYTTQGEVRWGGIGGVADAAGDGVFFGPAFGLAAGRSAGLAGAAKAGGVAKGVKELKPTLIQENPRNLIPTQTKAEMSGSQVKRLLKDMKQNGFDQSKPVDAWRNPNTGRLEIQNGHHRTEAAKKAGLDKIPVRVWK